MTDEFFVKIINDDVTYAERQEFEEWLKADNTNSLRFDEFKKIWELTDNLSQVDVPNTEAEWKAIKLKLDLEEDYKKSLQARKEKSKYSSHDNNYSAIGLWIVRIAAVLIIASLVILIDYKSPVYRHEAEQAVTPVEKNEIYTRTVGKGETATVRLADGSFVKMNSESQLKYPRFFEGGERLVELKGEAFFIVESNKNKPFKVQIGDLITEVVGTEFNIKARQSDNYELVVVKGEVKVYKDDSPETEGLSVKRGETVTYNLVKGFSKPHKAQTDHLTAWLQNKISFRNTRLQEVLEEIERLYDVNIKLLDKESKDKRLTGVFEKKSLRETLTAISISLDLNITYSDQTIIVDKIKR